jgi:hypothetical protein
MKQAFQLVDQRRAGDEEAMARLRSALRPVLAGAGS